MIGDADCSGDIDLDDVTTVLRDAGGLDDAPCAFIGNVKCNDPLNPVDAVMILAYHAELDVEVPGGCPTMG